MSATNTEEIVVHEWEAVLSKRRILVTGHTGFTGAWLCLWLHKINCEVVGLSLPPHTAPSLYGNLSADKFVESHIQDINDAEAVSQIISAVAPECIIHLAAQSLVHESYANPLETFATNIMGTANILEAARQTPSVKSVLCITTDKVYRNNEWHWPYREIDELGGKDPYSASKSGAEIVISSYRETLREHGNNFALASARGGNIIGGGDWAANRIVPDFVRALMYNSDLVLRNPGATRPWQHVLSLVHGYLMLTARLLDNREAAEGVWNLGPNRNDARSVRTLVESLSTHWRRPNIQYQTSSLHEARFLSLDSTKAHEVLGWMSPWEFDDVVRQTAHWYSQVVGAKQAALNVCNNQLDSYRAALGS
jgi:CDP-glucose 4,6-dehydratase